MAMTDSLRLPTATVIVPTFGRPAAIGRCVEALGRLDYPRDRLEILIVNDGGADLLPEEISSRAPGFTVRIVTQTNRGPASARNHGARVAQGEVIAFTDDDCRPEPAWLATLARGVQAEPAALVGGRVVNTLGGNRFAQASQDLLSFLYDYFPEGRELRPFFTANNVACARTGFLRSGGFDETFRYSAAEDRDLSERWASGVGPLRYLPDAIVGHAHDLTLGRFLRQHHYYGRGAVHLARRRRLRGSGRPRPEPLSFYARMLAFPIRRHGWPKGAPIAALVAVAQLSGVLGMAVEVVSPANRVEPSRKAAGAVS
jgi:GT2 family glycosyltransferase